MATFSGALAGKARAAINTAKSLPEFPESGRIDPYHKYKFLIEIDGFVSAGFQKATGLKMNTDVVEYREGGEITTPHKSPGLTKFENITMERGYSDSLDMWNWARQVFSLSNGIVPDPEFRRNISIILLDRVNQEAKRWTIYRAWVGNYIGGDFDAMSSEVLIEQMEIVHEGFDMM